MGDMRLGRFDQEPVANRTMKAVGPGGAIDRAKPHHAASADDAPPLTGSFHSDLQHVPMGALDDA